MFWSILVWQRIAPSLLFCFVVSGILSSWWKILEIEDVTCEEKRFLIFSSLSTPHLCHGKVWKEKDKAVIVLLDKCLAVSKRRQEHPDNHPVVKQLAVTANQGCVRVRPAPHQILTYNGDLKSKYFAISSNLESLDQEEGVTFFSGADSYSGVLLHRRDVYRAQCRAQLHF